MNYSLFRFAVIPALAFLSAATPCLAVELEWNAGTSDWFTPGNWSPSGPPTNADWAHVDNGGNAQIAAPGAISNIVELGSAAGESGTVSVSGIGTLNVPNLFDIGFAGTGTLNITAGGIVTARTTRIGSSVGSTGLLSVDGGGSSYSAPIDSINVALFGHGTMNVTNGGEVTSFSGIIAQGTTAVGVVTINGIGSNWTMSDQLIVAYTGSGTLNIQNGGDVTNTDGIIGGASFVPVPVNATGIVNVTGTGSTWTNNGNLTVGLAAGATGTLNISTGGTVSSASAIIGDAAGSTGTVNLSIMGATWTITGNLTVGNSGNGTLHINNNGFVSNSAATIADQVGSVGTVTVTEQWTNSSTLTVGNSGNATLDITAGSVTNTSGTIADQVGSTGTVTVSQSGAWTNSSDLTVANSGTGTMNITTMGDVTDTSAIIANQIGSTGVANVANGTWTNSSSLTVANSGNGTLNITLAGAVSNTAGTIAGQTGSTGTANVDGAGSAWINTGGLIVGDSGSGQLHITNGGAVSNTFGSLGSSAGSIGTATIDGTGSVWTNGGTLAVGSLGTGSMTITNGGAVHSNQAPIGSLPSGNGTAIVDGTGSIWTTSSVFVGGDAGGPKGTGLLRILNGGTVTSGNAIVWSSGTLEIGINPNLVAPLTFDGGTLRTIANTTFTNSATLATGGVIVDSNGFTSTLSGIFGGPGGLTKINPGTIVLTNANTYTGNTNINGGSLIVDGSIASVTFVNSAGLLGGTGTIGNTVFNSGVVSPGHSPGSPGTLTIGSSYVQNADGTLRIEIGGLAAPQHDLLAVGGGASLDGTLQILRLNNFTPAAGDRVTIITNAAPHIGTFDNVTGDFFGVLRPVPHYDEPNDVYVIFELGSFNTGGLTPNQQAVANNLDDAANDPAAAALINFLQFLPLGALPHEYDLIAPEELAAMYEISISRAMVQNNNLQRRMDDIRAGSNGFCANNFVAHTSGKEDLSKDAGGKVVLPAKDGPEVYVPTENNRWGVFINGTGDFVNVGDDDFNAPGYDITTGDFTLGVDYRLSEHFAVGINGGYSSSRAELVNDGEIEADGGKIGAYATVFGKGFFGGRIYIDGAIGGGLNNYDTLRIGLQDELVRGDTDGSEFNALISYGSDWTFGCFNIGTWSTIQYTRVNIDEFTELGSLAPLEIQDQSEDSLRSTTGLRASYDIKAGRAIIRPELRAAWQHEHGDRGYQVDARLASGAGGVFRVHGPEMGRDAALVGAGVNVQWSRCLSTYVYYDGVLGRNNYDNNAITGGLRVGF